MAILINLSLASASHFVVGNVQDAKDGTSANGYIITLWNPYNGLEDNLTDVIGSAGNSGQDNIYLFDCSLLLKPCRIGDELRLKVFNNGDGYKTRFARVIVSANGFTEAKDLKLIRTKKLFAIEV